MNKDWLEKLKPGDYVIVSGGGPLGHDIAKKVERLTKTQIVLQGSDTRYKRNGGWQVGGTAWHRTYLREATKERLADVIHKQKCRALVNKLTNIKWSELELETLEAVVSALETESEK